MSNQSQGTDIAFLPSLGFPSPIISDISITNWNRGAALVDCSVNNQDIIITLPQMIANTNCGRLVIRRLKSDLSNYKVTIKAYPGQYLDSVVDGTVVLTKGGQEVRIYSIEDPSTRPTGVKAYSEQVGKTTSSGSLACPITPINNIDVANKQYVDNAISSSGAGITEWRGGWYDDNFPTTGGSGASNAIKAGDYWDITEILTITDSFGVTKIIYPPNQLRSVTDGIHNNWDNWLIGNNALLRDAADYDNFFLKILPTGDDSLLIEDAADGKKKKHVSLQALPISGAVQTELDRKAYRDVLAVDGNILTEDADGNPVNSGKTFGDDGTVATVPTSNILHNITTSLAQGYTLVTNAPNGTMVIATSNQNLTSSSAYVIEGRTLIAGDDVTLTNQTLTKQNGYYRVAGIAGSWSLARIYSPVDYTTWNNLVNTIAVSTVSNPPVQVRCLASLNSGTVDVDPILFTTSNINATPDKFNFFVSSGGSALNTGQTEINPVDTIASVFNKTPQYPLRISLASSGSAYTMPNTITGINVFFEGKGAGRGGQVSLSNSGGTVTHSGTFGAYKNVIFNNFQLVLSASGFKIENCACGAVSSIAIKPTGTGYGFITDCDFSSCTNTYTLDLSSFSGSIYIRDVYALRVKIATNSAVKVYINNCAGAVFDNAGLGNIFYTDTDNIIVNAILSSQAQLTALLADTSTTTDGYYTTSFASPSVGAQGDILYKQSVNGVITSVLVHRPYYQTGYITISQSGNFLTYIKTATGWAAGGSSSSIPVLNTILTVAMTTTDVSATVASTNGFPASGVFYVDNEAIAYSGKTTTTFTGLTRGLYDSTAATHSIGGIVTSLGLPYNAGNPTGGNIIGVVMPFGGTTAPTGALICDGTAYSRTTYSALFAVIGTAYGAGNGSTTFNVPDLRGRFIRGVDGTAGRDPDSSSRTAMNTGGNTGNQIGSVQADSFASHTHTLAGDSSDPAGGGTRWAAGTSNNGFKGISSGIAQATGGTETRPKNAYANFIIWYNNFGNYGDVYLANNNAFIGNNTHSGTETFNGDLITTAGNATGTFSPAVIDSDGKLKKQPPSATISATVISTVLTTPPVSPNVGDTYFVPSGATDAWSGQFGNITSWDGSAWGFTALTTNQIISDVSDQTWQWNGTALVAYTIPGGSGGTDGNLYGYNYGSFSNGDFASGLTGYQAGSVSMSGINPISGFIVSASTLVMSLVVDTDTNNVMKITSTGNVARGQAIKFPTVRVPNEYKGIVLTLEQLFNINGLTNIVSQGGLTDSFSLWGYDATNSKVLPFAQTDFIYAGAGTNMLNARQTLTIPYNCQQFYLMLVVSNAITGAMTNGLLIGKTKIRDIPVSNGAPVLNTQTIVTSGSTGGNWSNATYTWNIKRIGDTASINLIVSTTTPSSGALIAYLPQGLQCASNFGIAGGVTGYGTGLAGNVAWLPLLTCVFDNATNLHIYQTTSLGSVQQSDVPTGGFGSSFFEVNIQVKIAQWSSNVAMSSNVPSSRCFMRYTVNSIQSFNTTANQINGQSQILGPWTLVEDTHNMFNSANVYNTGSYATIPFAGDWDFCLKGAFFNTVFAAPQYIGYSIKRGSTFIDSDILSFVSARGQFSRILRSLQPGDIIYFTTLVFQNSSLDNVEITLEYRTTGQTIATEPLISIDLTSTNNPTIGTNPIANVAQTVPFNVAKITGNISYNTTTGVGTILVNGRYNFNHYIEINANASDFITALNLTIGGTLYTLVTAHMAQNYNVGINQSLGGSVSRYMSAGDTFSFQARPGAASTTVTTVSHAEINRIGG